VKSNLKGIDHLVTHFGVSLTLVFKPECSQLGLAPFTETHDEPEVRKCVKSLGIRSIKFLGAVPKELHDPFSTNSNNEGFPGLVKCTEYVCKRLDIESANNKAIPKVLMWILNVLANFVSPAET
jgi:hypothetical protein